jgi:hypothetical protein
MKLYHGEQTREEQLASGRISDRKKTDKCGVHIGPCASKTGRAPPWPRPLTVQSGAQLESWPATALLGP